MLLIFIKNYMKSTKKERIRSVIPSFFDKYYDFNYAALRRACPGAHCLHADSSKGMLRNDEIVVYKEEQIMPLYLIEIG